MRRQLLRGSCGAVLLSVVALTDASGQEEGARWIAGDHHIHSRFSVGWNRDTDPPSPVIGGDAIYPIPMNALMARHFGLSWMVATDHGGPNHSKVNLEHAYPELLMSREVVPDLVQFYGMEFDTPGADHSSMIIPHSHEEAEQLRQIESTFSRNEPWPPDPAWNQEPRMLEALVVMRDMQRSPVVIANHPSRSASAVGVYGMYSPAELRAWNDTAPTVAVGMAGAPGHQAVTLNPDGTISDNGWRGGYRRAPTMGGFDQMTARLGGFWDSMLGEGRRWWITANSDSHVNWREGGSDFWPGEYSKTYVLAEKNHASILDGIRNGRVFVTLGDLISELWVAAEVVGEGQSAGTGGAVDVPSGSDVLVTIRFRDPAGANHAGRMPEVRRVDLIIGEVHGPVDDPNADANPTTRVLQRFGPETWAVDGEYREAAFLIERVDHDSYLRVRGTNGDEAEPLPDTPGEDPWTDLWFYSNPIFLQIR